MKRQKPHWGYGRRLWLEFIFVLAIIGTLIYLQAKVGMGYIISAEMTEAVYLARDMQTRMQVEYAMTGEWPSGNNLYMQNNEYNIVVDTSFNSSNGHVALQFKSKYLEVDKKQLAFNLYELDAGVGFKFFAWRCGNYGMGQPYKTTQPLVSTISPLYSNTVCRNYP